MKEAVNNEREIKGISLETKDQFILLLVKGYIWLMGSDNLVQLECRKVECKYPVLSLISWMNFTVLIC